VKLERERKGELGYVMGMGVGVLGVAHMWDWSQPNPLPRLSNIFLQFIRVENNLSCDIINYY